MTRTFSARPFRVLAGFFLAAGFSLSFVACGSSTVRPGSSAEGFELASLRSDSSAVVVSPAVRLEGFERAFAKAYGSGDALVREFSDRLLDSLSRGGLRVSAIADSLLPFPAEDGEHFAFPSPPARFVIRVHGITVSRTTREVPSAVLPTYGENAKAPAGGGTSEGCAVSMIVEVWEVIPGGFSRRYAFAITGRADVPLYAYKSALREAVAAAARGAARHLRQGRAAP